MFVELTDSKTGKSHLVNLANVTEIVDVTGGVTGDGALVCFVSSGHEYVREPLDEIVGLIESGVPVRRKKQ